MNLTWQDHLDAIAAATEDDAPRLVCADWLMQRGDPRGEYIALCLDTKPTREKLARLAAVKAENDWLTPLLREGAQSFNARVDGAEALMRSPHLGELRLLVVKDPVEVTSRLVLPGVSIEDRRTELWD